MPRALPRKGQITCIREGLKGFHAIVTSTATMVFASFLPSSLPIANCNAIIASISLPVLTVNKQAERAFWWCSPFSRGGGDPCQRDHRVNDNF